jgi:hypothetical protein
MGAAGFSGISTAGITTVSSEAIEELSLETTTGSDSGRGDDTGSGAGMFLISRTGASSGFFSFFLSYFPVFSSFPFLFGKFSLFLLFFHT